MIHTAIAVPTNTFFEVTASTAGLDIWRGGKAQLTGNCTNRVRKKRNY